MNNTLVRAALLAAIALSTSGCFSRYLLTVEDGPSEGTRTTIVKTFDYNNNVIFRVRKWVYWECREDGQGLYCEKRCDVKDDEGDKLLCQKSVGFL